MLCPASSASLGKARETEGKNGVGTINRAAQAIHFEAQSFLAVNALDDANIALATNPLGVTVESEYYTFATTAEADAFDTTATTVDGVDDGVRSYSGAVDFAAGVYTSAVCQSNAIAAAPVAVTDTTAANPCPADFTNLR